MPGHVIAGAGPRAAHLPRAHTPLVQSAPTTHAEPAAHAVAQSPPQRPAVSLGVQHASLTHRLVQSASTAHIDPSAQETLQFPPQTLAVSLGVQQIEPSQEFSQSLEVVQLAPSAHETLQSPPQTLEVSLGVQQMEPSQKLLLHSASIVQVSPLAQLGAQVVARTPAAHSATTTLTSAPRVPAVNHRQRSRTPSCDMSITDPRPPWTARP